jgi:guanylate kinase
VSPVRSDWQAIHLVQVEELFEANNLLFAEVFHTFGGTLRAKAAAKKVPVLSVFLVPAEPGTPPAEIVSIMRQKLERRGVDDQKKIDERSKDAPGEIENSRHYTHVLLNRVGEDDTDEWGEFGTRDGKAGERAVHSFDDLGPAARWLTEKFLAILNGELPEGFYQRPS